jgi:hypothetical protein
MDGDIVTMQDFFLHTKAITYIIMVLALIAFTCFWRFLSGRDDD